MGNSFMKAFIVLALSILQTTVCYADTFKGKVVNAETGEVIVGARVERDQPPTWMVYSEYDRDRQYGMLLSEW